MGGIKVTSGQKTASGAAFTPLLQQLVTLMGRPVSDPALAAFVTGTLGRKMPTSSSGASTTKYVVAKPHGIELGFNHDVKNERYPLIARTKALFVPYLHIAWLKENFPEPLPFGISHGMAAGEIAQRLGRDEGVRKAWKVRYWRRTLDAARDVVLDVEEDGHIAIEIVQARGLASRSHPATPIAGLFLAWAVARGLIDAPRFAAHAGLVAAVGRREKKGSDLFMTAIPRGIWDVHLKDAPGLRDFAYGWFHNMDHGYIVADLIAVFGARQGKHGHNEPVLDDDDWNAVDRATPLLDTRFAAWLVTAG
jgi:hypothetical protein